jgi:hypothetical protein
LRNSRNCKLPTHGDLRDDPVVAWAFRKAIHDSVVASERGHEREAGGWIYQCRTPAPDTFEAVLRGREYYLDVVFMPEGARSKGGVKLRDEQYRPFKPGNPDCRTVGTFHTHPSPLPRANALSEPDKVGGDGRGVPAFMIQNWTPWGESRSVEFPAYCINEYAGWDEPGLDNLSWQCSEQACGEPGFDSYRVPSQLPASAGQFTTPVNGAVWDVTNFRGQMVCGGFTVPLAPSTSTGRIEVRNEGQTLVGTGFESGTAPITMRAVPGLKGRYSGSVGGMRDGIPMTIDFCWQLITDKWITGYLKSEVQSQGVVCKMSRDFEMRSDAPDDKEPEGEIPFSAVFHGEGRALLEHSMK